MAEIDVHLYLDGTNHLREVASGKTVIAVDILRATTTITTAIANGARQVIPVLSPEEARQRQARDLPNALLGGERRGLRIEGFDFGNSPREYTASNVAGRSILFTTTNGTRLIRAVPNASDVLMGAFANLSAVCAWARALGRDVLIACAGTEGRFTLEDGLFAGACVERLRPSALGDAAIAAEALWARYGKDIEGAFRLGRHGRTLVDLGLEEDLSICARVDVTDAVAVLDGDAIIRRSL